MSKSVANVVIATDTFEGWIVKTNILLDALSNEIITVAANTTGAVTTGNGSVNGSLQATVLVAGSQLRGGEVSVANTLTITSNVVANSVSTFNANVIVNSVANVYMTATSATVRGGQFNVTSNTVVSAATVDITTSGQLTISAGGGLNITGSLGDIDTGVVNATAIVGVGAGFSNINVFTSNATFTVPTGVRKIKYTLTGGGGGGGGAPKANATHGYFAGGGGGGGTATGIISVTPGEPINIIIGAGGVGGVGNTTAGGIAVSTSTAGTNSSMVFANTLTILGTGGAGGSDADNTNRNGGLAANGGIGSGGTINIQGGLGGGGGGQLASWAYNRGPYGGETVFGPGPVSDSPKNNVSANGRDAINKGSGGSGGVSASLSANGGAGAPGILIIEY